MKQKLQSLLFIASFLLISSVNGQAFSANKAIDNDVKQPCITSHEYSLIEKRCQENSQRLKLKVNFDIKRAAVTVPLAWPLRAAAALKDCSFYNISAYVDQNTTGGVFQDFNCGTNSYDSHTGTDISIWPFNFYKMDNSLVEIVAAAPGIILDKHDGEFDRNCAANNLTANYVIIQHADGSQILYWHMKKNSVTAKAIGATVTVGEYLGVVGSSGSSSGPHLHFEVWAGSTKATRVDPYSGACNTLNASSWWAAQKAYKETSVVKASVHTTDIVIPACPGTEIINESNSFLIPFQGVGLSPGYAKFYMFLRDEVNGLTADLSILNPDNSVNMSWTYTSTADRKTLMWGFSKKLPTIPGKYTFKVTYNNTSCTSTFDILTATGVDDIQINPVLNIYPNPMNGQSIVSFSLKGSGETSVCLLDISGKKIFTLFENNILEEGLYKFDLANLQIPDGIYFCELSNRGNKIIQKVIVQN